MVPAVLAGGALLAARRRPWLTGALTGLGAAIKLWPALLAGAFAVRRRGRGPMLGAFVGVGFGLAALSLAAGGASRLFSPLTWQSGRGLQIESVWATPLMVARAFDPVALAGALLDLPGVRGVRARRLGPARRQHGRHRDRAAGHGRCCSSAGSATPRSPPSGSACSSSRRSPSPPSRTRR